MTLRRHLFGMLLGLAALAATVPAASAQVVITDSPRVHGVQIVRHSARHVHHARRPHRRLVHRSSVRSVRHSPVHRVHHRG